MRGALSRSLMRPLVLRQRSGRTESMMVLAVTVKMHGAQYEIVMSTEDFSRARATLTGEEGNQP